MKILMRNEESVAIQFTNSDLATARMGLSSIESRSYPPEVIDDEVLIAKLQKILEEHGKAVADMLHKRELGQAVKAALESVQAFLSAVDRLVTPATPEAQ
jgi:hypothetical protein